MSSMQPRTQKELGRCRHSAVGVHERRACSRGIARAIARCAHREADHVVTKLAELHATRGEPSKKPPETSVDAHSKEHDRDPSLSSAAALASRSRIR